MPRDRQILEAASELFFARGYKGTSVAAIGERAGVTGPAIYSHFKNKDEILATLCLEALDTLLSGVGSPSDDPWADLDHLIRLHTSEILRDRKLASIYVRESRSLAPAFQRVIERRIGMYVGRWVETLARCYPDHSRLDVTVTANAAMGLVHSVVLWGDERLLGGAIDPELLTAMVREALATLDAWPARDGQD